MVFQYQYPYLYEHIQYILSLILIAIQIIKLRKTQVSLNIGTFWHIKHTDVLVCFLLVVAGNHILYRLVALGGLSLWKRVAGSYWHNNG